jgi:hypothetical protein
MAVFIAETGFSTVIKPVAVRELLHPAALCASA